MATGILWALVRDPGALKAAVPPRFAQHEAHHVTLRFGVDLRPYQSLLGHRFEARVTAEAWDDEVQAVRVALPPEVADLCQNAIPHVTISVGPGVSPKRANTMLAQPAHERPLAITLAFEIAAQRWRGGH